MERELSYKHIEFLLICAGIYLCQGSNAQTLEISGQFCGSEGSGKKIFLFVHCFCSGNALSWLQEQGVSIKPST